MDLKAIRDRIDGIDRDLVRLLGERMEAAVLAGRLKGEVKDPGREADVISAVKSLSHGVLGPEFCSNLWETLMGESRRIQEGKPETVGFQGMHGANSEDAARRLRGDWVAIPCAEFGEVIDMVSSGLLDYGILPVENTSGGYIGPVNALLVHTELKVVGAIDMPISHCLLSYPGTDYREIRTVYSHPQALAQCREFLQRNKLEPRQHFDTAGAARMIAIERPTASAAIAPAFAAELYGLEIVKEDVQDLSDNRTRFLVLAREGARPVGDGSEKCSVVFIPEHRSGSLYSALATFAKHGVNLTRIESVPVPDGPGRFAMFIDFEGRETDDGPAKALAELRASDRNLRVLGSYLERRLP